MAVNVKLGVDLSGFDKGVKSAKAEVKTLDQQMKMIEATFKATGDAEEAMKQKTETLNKQMEAQKRVASQAEQALKEMTSAGVDPASISYQKMARELLLAQTGMMETQAALNGLGTSAQDAAGKADELTTSVNSIGKKVSLDQVITGIDKIASGLENAAKKAIKLGKAVATEVLGAGSWADELVTTANAYGISTDELQRMQKTADIIDTSVDDIMQAKQKLGKSSDALSELFGITTTGRSIDDVFWETGEAIMAMGDAFQQEEAAQKVFGKGWRELVPLFDAGREEYERVNSTWKTVSDDQLKSLQELDDNYQKLKNDLETLKMEALSQLAEPMAKLVDSLNQLISSEEGQQAISDVMGALKDAFTWIVDNKDGVVVAIGAIATALAGLKVSEDVLTVVKTLDGLKGLLGLGGKGETPTVSTSTPKTTDMTLLSKAGALGLTGAMMLSPALIAGYARGIIPDEYKLGADEYVKSAKYTEDDLKLVREYAAVLNEISQMEEHMFDEGFDQQHYEELSAMRQALGAATETDLWKKYWTNYVANQDEKGDLFDLDMLDKMISEIEGEGGVPVKVDPQAEDGAAASISEQIGTVTVPIKLEYAGGAGVVMPGSHANGLPWVPYDGYLALLHRGERVMTARENRNYTYNSNNYFGNVNLNNGLEIDALCDSIDRHNRRQNAGFGG